MFEILESRIKSQDKLFNDNTVVLLFSSLVWIYYEIEKVKYTSAISDILTLDSEYQWGKRAMLVFIKSTKIIGGFNPR